MALWNPATVNPATSGVATPTSVAVSNTMQTILADNSNRKGATIWNYSNAPLCIDFGNSVSKTVFAYRISAGGYYEIPFGYTGIVSGIWDDTGLLLGTGGKALVRELI
ncbi:hypothetical protein NIES25_51630 [Nostoc linckia NIES-25]|nr:hypothetical protein NIES25_05930 [Nostoc linckia NIES-25]BAY78660.1 hypothetical protein NIES25_51360 [Nostoc linckia NIES-25]BAY78687.1 hypothetical protein NIES25_51630 [Nostoc linckia NIES-25]